MRRDPNKAAKKGSSYRGVLGAPMRSPELTLEDAGRVRTPKQLQEFVRSRIANQSDDRLKALFAEYGIDREEYYETHYAPLVADIERCIRERTPIPFEEFKARLKLHMQEAEAALWRDLALALAMAHVPGFTMSESRRGKGRPKTWEALRELELYLRFKMQKIELEQSGASVTEADVCKALEKQRKFLKPDGQPVRWSTLMRRVQRFAKSNPLSNLEARIGCRDWPIEERRAFLRIAVELILQ
ncbi:MAG: hypothetical protein K8I02_06235 [Candidatus Methylomirabilis sp.]|nr:hypothetical protein [Deltaproteobacteria bacterium]